MRLVLSSVDTTAPLPTEGLIDSAAIPPSTNRAAIKLQSGVTADVRVRRRLNSLMSEEVAIDEKSLVPGDILILDSGITLPADCMILEATNLQISQSRL